MKIFTISVIGPETYFPNYVESKEDVDKELFERLCNKYIKEYLNKFKEELKNNPPDYFKVDGYVIQSFVIEQLVKNDGFKEIQFDHFSVDEYGWDQNSLDGNNWETVQELRKKYEKD